MIVDHMQTKIGVLGFCSPLQKLPRGFFSSPSGRVSQSSFGFAGRGGGYINRAGFRAGWSSAGVSADSVHGVSSRPGRPTDFVDDEYVVYTATQQALAYLVEVELADPAGAASPLPPRSHAQLCRPLLPKQKFAWMC